MQGFKTIDCQMVSKTTSFSSLTEERKVGCKVWDQECPQILSQKTYKDVKPKEYKKLWNLHWALHTAWQKKQEGKWKQRQRTADESAQETSVDGQNLTICGGCQGYMDFFSEVFCVVSIFFFFFFFTFLHTKKTPRWKTLSKTKRRNKHSTLLSRTQIQSKRSVFLSVLVFYEQLSFILTFGKATVQVL